jgi:hypothetical protein
MLEFIPSPMGWSSRVIEMDTREGNLCWAMECLEWEQNCNALHILQCAAALFLRENHY